MQDDERAKSAHRRIDFLIGAVKDGVTDVNSAILALIENIAEAKAIDEMQYFLTVASEEMCRAAGERLEWIKRTYNFRFSGPYLGRITKEEKEQRDRELEPVYAAMYELCQVWERSNATSPGE
jgi:hypothetical protein